MIEQIFLYLSEIYQQNQFFQGAGILAVVSALWMYLRGVPTVLWKWFKYYTSISIEVQDNVPAFGWLARHIVDEFKNRNSGPFYLLKSNNKVDKNTLFPSGTRWTRKGLCWIQVTLSKRELENAANNKAVEHSIYLRFYGFKKKKILNNLLSSSKEQYGPKHRNLEIRKADYWDFTRVGDLKLRDRKTIYCDKLDELLPKIDSFLNSQESYKAKGIPYRLGILLHGIPGCGKTSVSQYVAQHTKRDLHIVSLKSESSLSTLLSGNDKLILLEDIDCATDAVADRSEDSNTSQEKNAITLSDILNAIDGVSTGENNILIFTTNHKDKLDPALIRPGRVDIEMELGYMNQNEFDQACQVLYEQEAPKQVRGDLTPARLQQVYLEHPDDFSSFLNKTT